MSCPAEGIESDVNSDCSATIYLDPRIYSREAILRASYWCTNAAWVRIPESASDRLAIQIKLKQAVPTLTSPKPIRIGEFVDEFCNALLDFELRRQIETETSGVRQLILAKAFSESGVLEDDPPGTVADPVETKNPSGLLQIVNKAASTAD